VIAAMISFLAEEILFLIVTFRMFKLRMADLLLASWRSILATTSWRSWSSPRDRMDSGRDRQRASGDGSGDRLIVRSPGLLRGLLAAWHFSGRPDGAETMFLGVIQDTWKTQYRQFVRPPRMTPPSVSAVVLNWNGGETTRPAAMPRRQRLPAPFDHCRR